jgi:ATP synthase protein I
MLLAIPSLLVVAPLVGFFLGKFADQRFKTTPWLTFVGLVLGFVSAGREIYFIIRRVQAEEESDKRP